MKFRFCRAAMIIIVSFVVLPFVSLSFAASSSSKSVASNKTAVSKTKNAGSQKACDNALPLDLIASKEIPNVNVKGLGGIEKDGTRSWRWGYGPETKIEFTLEKPRALTCELIFDNAYPGSEIELLINGETLGVTKEKTINSAVPFQAKKGRNTIVFKYNDWNHRYTAFAPADNRFLSVNFSEFKISPCTEK